MSAGMGVAASSFRKPKGEEGEMDELWVTLKAKTTCKRTRAVRKRKMQFQPALGSQTIGSDSSCDFVLDDSNLSPLHAHVELLPNGTVQLRTVGRTYFMIGQGVQKSGPHKLSTNEVVKMGACSLQITDMCVKPKTPVEDESVLKTLGDAGDKGMCYICFDDSSETGNELVPSPCTCRNLVHRQCLSRWITTKGSRLCSICKAKLPIEYTMDAPYLMLQVVRHMRGLHWAGEREYIISFNHRPENSVNVGSGTGCDLCLPDPSLSRVHSRLQFRDDSFFVEDLTSSAGTYLKLNDSHPLLVGKPAMFKMGRTMLTVKLERRRAGYIRSWRARKGKKPELDGAEEDDAARMSRLLSGASLSTPSHLAAAMSGSPTAALSPAAGAGGAFAGAGMGAAVSPVSGAGSPGFFSGGDADGSPAAAPPRRATPGVDDVVPLPAPALDDLTAGIEGVTAVEELDDGAVPGGDPALFSPQSAAFP